MTSSWEGTRLVIARELVEGARKKSYRVTLAVLLAGGLALAIVPRLLASDDRPSYSVAVVGAATAGFEEAVGSVADALEIDVQLRYGGGRSSATAAVRSGDLDAALVSPPGADTGEPREPPRLVQDDDTSAGLLAALGNAAVASSTTARLEAAGVSPGHR